MRAFVLLPPYSTDPGYGNDSILKILVTIKRKTHFDEESAKKLDNVATVGGIHGKLELLQKSPFLLCIRYEENSLSKHNKHHHTFAR